MKGRGVSFMELRYEYESEKYIILQKAGQKEA